MKHYFLGGLIFSGTVIVSFIGFAAYTNLPTQNTGDVMTSTIWNNLVNKVNTIGSQVDGLSFPAGAVMAFNLSTCPTGWSNYTRAVGRTIIGVGNGAGNNTILEETLGEKSSPTVNLTATLNVSANAMIGTASTTGRVSGITAGALLASLPSAPTTTLYAPSSSGMPVQVGPSGSVTGLAQGNIS